MLEDWQQDGVNLRSLDFTNKEKQIVLGTLLGNSSIIFPKKSKYPHLQMRESISKGGNWIRCKGHELKKFSRPKSFIADKDSYRWNSISNMCWKQFHNMCYKENEKVVCSKWLDQLQDLGLACWFMDKGELKANSCHLRISRLNKESVENIKNYFEIIGIPGDIKNIGGSRVLQFSKQNQIKFMKTIQHQLPLYYRLIIN